MFYLALLDAVGDFFVQAGFGRDACYAGVGFEDPYDAACCDLFWIVSDACLLRGATMLFAQ